MMQYSYYWYPMRWQIACTPLNIADITLGNVHGAGAWDIHVMPSRFVPYRDVTKDRGRKTIVAVVT